MWVIFEGLDKAGKTTLEWEFLKATNFKHVVIDRGPIGYKVFDELLGRSTSEGDAEFIKMAKQAKDSDDCMIVYCHCGYETAKKRLIEHNHEELPYNYHKAQILLSNNIKMHYADKVVDVNTDKPLNECIAKMVKESWRMRDEHN